MNNILQWFLVGRSGWYIGLTALVLAGLCFFAVILNGVGLWQGVHREPVLSAPRQSESNLSVLASLKPPAEWHLFGVPVNADSSILPRTHLQLELSGIMVGTEAGSPAMVIISAGPGQPGQVYRVGDTLPSLGVRVYAITRDGVVLENGGRFERLNLQRQQLPFKPLQKKSILGG